MRNNTHHRMTRKAASALELAYQISGENPIWIRRTHVVVRDAYAYLDRAGYSWDSEARQWFYSRSQEKARATLPFTLTAVPDDIDSVIYVVTEALKAAHYTVHITGEYQHSLSSLARSVLVVIEP